MGEMTLEQENELFSKIYDYKKSDNKGIKRMLKSFGFRIESFLEKREWNKLGVDCLSCFVFDSTKFEFKKISKINLIEISKIKKLKKLEFYGCDFLENFKDIDFSNLVNLEKLILIDCNDFPDCFYSLPNLKELKIYNFTSKKLNEYGCSKFVFEEIPDGFERFKGLKSLTMINQRIKKIPNFFKDFKSLEKINFNNNSFEEVPLFVKQIPNIQLASFVNNSVENVPQEINRFESGKIVIWWGMDDNGLEFSNFDLVYKKENLKIKFIKSFRKI